MITSRSDFLRMRNVSDKGCTGDQNTHFTLIKFFFENRTVAVQATNDYMADAHCMLGT
jgi:hypothetical protein